MTEATGGLAFTSKATEPFGIVLHFARQNLYGNSIAKQDVTAKVNGAHAAFAEQGLDFVLAVEDSVDQRGRIVFQNFAVGRAKAHAVFEPGFTNCAVFH
jgi:hypothetical protein